MKSLLRLLPFLRGHLPVLLIATACMVILAVTSAFYAFLAGPALKFIFSGNVADIIRTSGGHLRSFWSWVPATWVTALEEVNPTEAVWLMPVLIVATAILKGVAQAGQFYLLGRTSQKVLRDLRAETFDSLLRQSPSFFSSRTQGDLLSRLTADANTVEQAIFYGCAPLLREPLAVLALLVFCFVTDPKLALITFVTVPLAVVPLARFAKWIKRVSRRGQDIQGAINAVCHEALAGIRVVQSFCTEGTERAKLGTTAAQYIKQLLRSYLIRAVRTPTMEILGAFALAGLLVLLGTFVQRDNADAAHFVSFFVAVVMMYDPLKKLGNVTDYLAAGAAAAERIFEVVDAEPEIRDAPDATHLSGFETEVVFDHVGFSYNDAPVLEDVSLELRRGKVVALVGPSGAGKTTMAHLLPRFWDVSKGRILVDGHDLRIVTVQSLRCQMSLVGQDTFLFNASIAANIAYGCPDASRRDVEEAAVAAYAHEFILGLKKGYDTVVGERGVLLSGGQRQRVAIARALLRNAPLLILDEATSALDVESEQFVQRALEVLMQGRTSLVIAHRLSTIQRADTIAVLKDGRIIERGSHGELLADDGEYARLYRMQFQSHPGNDQTPRIL